MDSVTREIDAWLALTPAADRPVEELRQRIGRLSRLFDRLLDDIARRQNVSRADWSALSVIIRGGDSCTPTQLARTLDLTSGTITTRVKRLIEAGLVEADGDEIADARCRPIRATPAGHRLWATATAVRTGREADIVRGTLDAEALSAVNERLAVVLAAFETELGPGPRHDLPRGATGD